MVGVVSFMNPGATFVSLAAVISFYFIFRGCFDIVMAFACSAVPGWWVLLISGLIELGLGFWAAGSWNVSVVVLVAWVAAGALVHGIGESPGLPDPPGTPRHHRRGRASRQTRGHQQPPRPRHSRPHTVTA